MATRLKKVMQPILKQKCSEAFQAGYEKGVEYGWRQKLMAYESEIACLKALLRVERGIRATTVDAVEVVHGRWETVSSMLGYLCCSKCKDVYIWETWLEDGKWNYCPNCGAKMDGDGNV